MIEGLIAFALRQRFITLALVLLLTIGGIVSYHRLPIEAYPDVGDVKVEVITLWPGHAAEEVERLITIPLENELNGIANVTFLRSDTLFGLSNIRVLLADGTDDYWARQQAQERIAQAALPADAKPALGPLSSVIGEIYRYPRVQDAAAHRAQGPPGLGPRARVQEGVRRRRRRVLGGRDQAVSNRRRSREAPRLQPHAEAGIRRRLEQQRERRQRLRGAGRVPRPGARDRPDPVHARHGEHRRGRPEGHPRAGPRRGDRRHRSRDPARGAW